LPTEEVAFPLVRSERLADCPFDHSQDLLESSRNETFELIQTFLLAFLADSAEHHKA
jgi:hypothetical protein